MSKLSKEEKDQLINQILNRSVSEVIHKSELKAALESDKKLRIYCGFDPTGPYLHIGHAIIFRKLKQLQRLGHQIILLIGDFTAMIGDPTGRDKMREPLTREQVRKNSSTYLSQVDKILPLKLPDNPVEIAYNSQWQSKETKRDFIEHAFNLTVGQLLERDMFQERIKKNLPISLTEFIYPYLQGYDAVKLEADLQLGGTDQTFNMLVGRDLRKKMKNQLQMVLTTVLLPGTDGRKMSKSFNNSINLTDLPQNMYGKIMSIKDEMILPYFEHCTDVSDEALKIIRKELKTVNPKILKMRLAKIIVEQFYEAVQAEEAEQEFNRIFGKKEKPNSIRNFKIAEPTSLIDLLVDTGLASSRSAGSRLIKQSGVSFENLKISDVNFVVSDSGVLQAGKRNFINIVRSY